jgi:hypothetical protein
MTELDTRLPLTPQDVTAALRVAERLDKLLGPRR